MDPMDDSALLRRYVESADDEAFAALVNRHVNLVYSVALRHVGDPHQAEEITQAVFITLARKAGQVRKAQSLSSWLFQATRWTANNFIRSEYRRQRRDHEAHMQSILNESSDDVWPRIAPLLDAAVAALSEKDRRAVMLRFYEGRNLREIGAALGASEDAAEKRVGRAVEKLQRFFFKRGIDSSTAILSAALAANSVHVAPAALAKAATAAALAGAASTSTLTLVKATLLAMKIKSIVIPAAAVVILAAGTFLLTRTSTSSATGAAPEVLPVQFANDAFHRGMAGLLDTRFTVDADASVKRTADSAPAAHIKSLVAPKSEGSADFLASPGTNRLQCAESVRYEINKGSALLGKRVRLSGWMKASDVRNWAGATLLVVNKDGRIFADDDMPDRAIHGTADWQQIEFVTDIPKEPCTVIFIPALYGTGEIWFDDFQMNIAPPNTPITDDRRWHFWSENPNDYSANTDYLTMHGGHPTLCIIYTPEGKAPAGSWMWWGQDIRTPDKYRCHTVRMSGWIKTENVSGHVHPNLRPKGPNFKLLARDTMIGDNRLRGTLDWTKYSLACLIPKDTQCLDTGFAVMGSGKVWIDMDSLKYEIVK